MSDNYVAYCRYKKSVFDSLIIETCNQDDYGAFKVYREADELLKAAVEFMRG